MLGAQPERDRIDVARLERGQRGVGSEMNRYVTRSSLGRPLTW
jgi:hypothetical protein